MSSTQTNSDSKEQEAKEYFEAILENQVKETLKGFCIENLFSGFGMPTALMAAFSINTQKILVKTLKELAKEFENEQIINEG